MEAYSTAGILVPGVAIIGLIVFVWILFEVVAYRQVVCVRRLNELNWKKGLRIVKNGEGSISLQEFRETTKSYTKNKWDGIFSWVTLGVYDDTDDGRAQARKCYSYYMDELLKDRRSRAENERKQREFCDRMERLDYSIADITDEILKP